jgi:hypothetical protein
MLIIRETDPAPAWFGKASRDYPLRMPDTFSTQPSRYAADIAQGRL